MRIVLALRDPAQYEGRLRDAGAEVSVLSGPQAPARALAASPTDADAVDIRAELAAADVLVVAGGRASLTSRLITACDDWGVRVVAVCRRTADVRLAEDLGVVAMDPTDDPWQAVALTPGARSDPRDTGRIIVVWGPAGAPGRTTLATELAGELARDGRRVALVDADSHAPSLALATGLPDEGPGFAAACRQAARGELTPAELSRIAVPLGDVLVLPGLNRPGRWPELSAERVAAALSGMRAWADEVVVDVAAALERDEEIVSDLDGPRRNAATLAALAAADLVVAVVGADPVGVSRFVRAYPDLRATVGAAPVRVVVNKTRGGALGIDPRGQVRRTLQRYTGIDRAWFVPWDPRAADAALLAARPIALRGGRGAIPAAVRRFVGEVVAPPPPAARRSRQSGRRKAPRAASDPAGA